MTEIGAKRIEEQVVDGRRLGRHVHHDPRSKKFVAEQATAVKDVWHVAHGLPLDQGNWGSCTGNALIGAVNSDPNDKGPYVEADAFKLYQAETKLEGYTTPPDDPGGSGVEVCKAAKAAGLISSYTHTFSFDSALKALVLRPGMIGCNWYSSFDSPDAHGFVSLPKGAKVRGGHEFVVCGISNEREAVLCWNSWGDWGPYGGRFWLPFKVWERLLSEQGDVTFPVVV